MTEEQLNELLNSLWYLHEHHVPVIEDGFQKTYYECFISLSPSYDEGKRFRLANMQRWFGIPGYNGYVEQAVGRHLVEVHNEHVRRQQEKLTAPQQETLVEPQPEKLEDVKPKKKRSWTLTPEQKARRREVALRNLSKINRGKKPKEAETASNGTVPQGQPVQTQENQTQEQVQSQEKTPRKILINSTSNL